MITLGVFSESVCNRQQFPTCDITLGWGVSLSVCSRQQLSVCDDTKADLFFVCLFFLLIGKYLCDISACQSYL